MQQFVFQVDEAELQTRSRLSTVIHGSAVFSRTWIRSPLPRELGGAAARSFVNRIARNASGVT
jgi:hypothetical protein